MLEIKNAKEYFDSKVRFKIISNNYVSIMFLYLTFNEYGFTEEISNIQC